MPTEDDDPVIASYDVFISSQPTLDPAKPSPKLFVLQYPSHRPHTRPYTSSRSQKPTSLRIKPETGIFEVDIPLFTSEHYNRSKGHEYGKAIQDAKQHNPYTSHGLSGGFSQNPPSHSQPLPPLTLSDIPAHNGSNGDNTNTTPAQHLATQTLGGKIAPTSNRTPVYMLATMNSRTKELHLTHIDGVVQLRPQLHHIDALEDQKRRADAASRFKQTSASNANANDSGLAPVPAPVKLETKAIEMKIKDASKEDPNRSLNVNAKLLRDIQADRWLRHDWIEPDHDGTDETYNPPIQISSHGDETIPAKNTQLKSALDNDEWLNKMSSPGIELRTRLKGRDRERARRKRQERLRAAKADTSAIPSTSGTAANKASASTNPAASASTIGSGGISTAVTGSEVRAPSTLTDINTGPFVEGSASETASSDEEEDQNPDEEHQQGEGEEDDMALDKPTKEAEGERQSEVQEITAPRSRSRPLTRQQQQHPVSESPKVQIKQESANIATAPAATATATNNSDTPTSTPTTTKRRGRPPKK